jgi:hypothetical protein
MKYVDYACAWILFAAGMVGMVATEVRHPPQAVLDTPLLWIFVAMFNLLRLSGLRLKMFGPFGLVAGLPMLAELIFSLRTIIVGRERQNV